MTQSKPIVVTGATGSLGRAVVEELKIKGFSVIAGTTNPAEKPQVCGVSAQRVVYDDLEGIDAVLQGADGLFLMAPPLDPESDTKGSRKNNLTFSPPTHPAQQGCANTEYAGYSLIFAPC
jgi:uncharacterized protein YbjT (DUF2867 family)